MIRFIILTVFLITTKIALANTENVSESFIKTPTALSSTIFDSSDPQAVTENIIYLRKYMKNVSDDNILKIAKYLAYIKLTPGKFKYQDEVTRLLNSSMQFIICDNFENLACLESKPVIDPNWDMRKDSKPDLGVPIKAGFKLDIEYYFTQSWYINFMDKDRPYINPTDTVAMKLGEKIQDKKNASILMAMYGIDDLSGSMSSVFNAVAEKVTNKIPVKAVVDVSDSPTPDNFIRDYDLVKNSSNGYNIINMPNEIDYSYIIPINSNNWAFVAPNWAKMFLEDVKAKTAGMKRSLVRMFLATDYIKVDPAFVGNGSSIVSDAVWMTQNKTPENVNSTSTRISFQYNGTMDFIRTLNSNTQANEQAMAHIEYPFTSIMHNKFVVFEAKNKKKSVWTGTANISRTCMGTEENANLSIFIKNDQIARAFRTEFDEMYEAQADANRPSTLATGLFHNKKRPNTHRYFSFTDGTHVRVHFSPTDDAEHKVILPMIYSARNGDKLRISMFGSAGYELVRALQSAAARGVQIQIAIDSLVGVGDGSWVKSPEGNLFETNPFAIIPAGTIEVRSNNWPGLNHHKSSTLTRKLPSGKYRPETIIIGSQNWSASGNDSNDENVVSITNKRKALAIMLAYNKEFDEKIWTSSKPVVPTAKVIAPAAAAKLGL